ncbi:MAG: DUF4386 family protein [Rhizobiaceae bacterium]
MTEDKPSPENNPFPARATGIAAISLAVLFNVPFSILGSIYNYPDILRQPAGEALALFAKGGPALILTWYAFGLAALALAPMAVALSINAVRLKTAPALAIGAALFGALAGTLQAIGLMRWVFAIPGVAAAYANPNASEAARYQAERAFDLLNAWGGVAIGEHLGQLLTALFVLMLSLVQWREQSRVTAVAGFATAAAIALGTGEGLAIVLGQNGGMFSLATIAGFLGLTIWLILAGLSLVHKGI